MYQKIKTLIIEDEPLAIKLLTAMIDEYCLDLELCGTANNVQDGLALIQQCKPEIIFVDVQVGTDTIFSLFEHINHLDYRFIFTTAHEKFAMQAFKVEAVDYLLKPYSPKELIRAVDKVKKTRSNLPIEQIKQLFESQNMISHHRIPLNTQTEINWVNHEDIMYCTADGAYCTVFLVDKSKVLVSKTLGDIEQKLGSNPFYRVHASHLINLNHVKKYIKEEGGSIIMQDGKMIPLSRRKKKEFLDMLV